MGRTRRFSSEHIRDVYMESRCLSTAAQQLGVHHTTISYHLRLLGVAYARRAGQESRAARAERISANRQRRLEHAETATRLFLHDWLSINETARRMGMSRERVRGILLRNGVVLTGDGTIRERKAIVTYKRLPPLKESREAVERMLELSFHKRKGRAA